MAQSLGTGAQGKESRGPFSIVNAAWATGSARESSARQVRGRNRGGDPFRGRQWPAPSGGKSRNGCLPIPRGRRRTAPARGRLAGVRGREFEIFRNCALR